jgi:ATP-dependent Clp protease ATP-binding subunit ClpB
MQHEIDDRLAKTLLAGDIREGDHVVVALDASGDSLALSSTDGRPVFDAGDEDPFLGEALRDDSTP